MADWTPELALPLLLLNVKEWVAVCDCKNKIINSNKYVEAIYNQKWKWLFRPLINWYNAKKTTIAFEKNAMPPH
jgi:hypothetical protein